MIALEGLKGQIIYKNQAFNKAEHVIALLKIEEHFHAITSLPAFLNRSYFCLHCERANSEETSSEHNCRGRTVPLVSEPAKSALILPPGCHLILHVPSAIAVFTDKLVLIPTRAEKTPVSTDECTCLALQVICFPIALNELKNDTHNLEVNHYLLTNLLQHRSILNYVYLCQRMNVRV